jgi:site-specific DNA-methyltransferase (adenine-specific)
VSIRIFHGNNLDITSDFPDSSYRLIYIDPPFNTGRRKTRGKNSGYRDRFDDYTGFLRPRIEEAKRLLTPDGSFFLHLDCREVHYAKVLCDEVFGRASFVNEIIWAYDFGARSRKKWSAKHDNILWYAVNPKEYVFNYGEIDRVPYRSRIVTADRRAIGKPITDVWWCSVVNTVGKERTGYPTQKPMEILQRIVRMHSHPGDKLLDFFAGSGSFGHAAAEIGRDCDLIDSNEEAIRVMKQRLSQWIHEQ